MPYEFEETVDEELNTMMKALKGSHHGSCILAAQECLKCSAERHLNTSTLPRINQRNMSAYWHIQTALKENNGNLNKAIRQLEELSADWDGINLAIRICKEHLNLCT
ncbi:MAG: hypothetical protein EOP45_20250 [Sphingobacteriaceae bacterium]|nr:MAG: hypothetical protein EOP45_20250 [Sphingobacteriaceae bacterium]